MCENKNNLYYDTNPRLDKEKVICSSYNCHIPCIMKETLEIIIRSIYFFTFVLGGVQFGLSLEYDIVIALEKIFYGFYFLVFAQIVVFVIDAIFSLLSLIKHSNKLFRTGVWEYFVYLILCIVMAVLIYVILMNATWLDTIRHTITKLSRDRVSDLIDKIEN